MLIYVFMEKYLLRRLTPSDRPLHERMSELIVANLPRLDFLIPMTKEEYEDTFVEGSEDVVYGLFEDDNMIATSSLLHDVRAYADQEEVKDILGHKCAEIGECMVLPSHRGQGLMLKLNELLRKDAQGMGIEYMLATAHPENVASNSSLRKLGFQLVKTFDRHGYLRNLYVMKVLTPYEEYCKHQLDDMEDDMDGRCFGDMLEGHFVRSH